MARPGSGLVARHAVGSADLVRLVLAEGLEPRLAASLTGRVEAEPRIDRDELPQVRVPRPRFPPAGAVPAAQPTPKSAEMWMVDREQRFPEALSGASEPQLPEALARVDLLPDAELRARTLERPRVPPLAPWRRLAPALRAILSQPVGRVRVDERRLVERCARLQPVHRIPRRIRRRWAHRIRVLWDRAEILAGFADDQRSVLRWLRRWRGPVGLEIVTVDDGGGLHRLGGHRAGEESVASTATGGGAPGPGPVPPGAVVLALSDLGFLGVDGMRRDWWAATGRKLRAFGMQAVALTLAPARRWADPVARGWRMVPWERVRPHGRGAGEPRLAGTEDARLVEHTLDLLSVSARIDTAVLRSVRRLVSGADLAVESDVRQHPDVVLRSEHGIVLEPSTLGARRKRFFEAAPRLCEQVVAVLRRCHRDLAPCLLHEELLLAGTDAERAAALDYFARLARRVGERGIHEPDFNIGPYVASWRPRRGPSCWEHDPLAWLWALVHRTADGLSFDQALPEGLQPSLIAWALRRREEVRWWRVVQRGDTLVVSLVGDPGTPLDHGDGFLVGHLPARVDFLYLHSAEAGVHQLPLASSGLALALPSRGHQVLETDGGVLGLRSTSRPQWARSIVRQRSSAEAWLTIDDLGAVPWPTWARSLSRDQHGVAAELELGRGVGMLFRWIPPGSFLMGSPEDEAGRLADEGPQRKVTLTRGFWLAATPCTQQQWRAVMGSNPSKHQGEHHPVENVSWEECREFCERLRERFPSLSLRLPTEAEWEYACRAGTTSAFNDGSSCTKPTGKDAALELLGWYRENGSSRTHSVAQKAANAWGLFDMHGNVWEWCEDWWQDDYRGADAVDPAGPAGGLIRVIRGGSAWNNARNCRSAFRFRWHPRERDFDQGFRPAAGQPLSKEPPEGAREDRASEEASSGGKEGGTTDSRRARLWWPGRTKKGRR